MQTKSEWSEGAVSKSVGRSVSQPGGGGTFTRTKELGDRHLVFATFLTSAWRRREVKEGWRWRWGGEGQRGEEGGGAEQRM